MRKLFLAVAILGLVSCRNPQAVALKRAWDDIRGPYLEYVQKDTTLTISERSLREQHCQLMDLTLKDMVGNE